MSQVHLVLVTLIIIGLTSTETSGQPVPSSDIVLMWTPGQNSGQIGANLVNVTNRPGYDNQPHFEPDGTSLLYTSIREDQADIYRFDLTSGVHTRLTYTPESEYSPSTLPTKDGFSVVRVESGGAQRIWNFDSSGKNPQLFMQEPDSVGYFEWAGEWLYAFVITDPPSLVVMNIGEIKTIATDIGRCLKRVPESSDISYVQNDADGQSWIMRYSQVTGRSEKVFTTIPEAEDFAWVSGEILIMGQASVLYYWMPGYDTWQQLADFSSAGFADISRVAVSPDGQRIALVVSR